jgi:hypothetical protein
MLLNVLEVKHNVRPVRIYEDVRIEMEAKPDSMAPGVLKAYRSEGNEFLGALILKQSIDTSHDFSRASGFVADQNGFIVEPIQHQDWRIWAEAPRDFE